MKIRAACVSMAALAGALAAPAVEAQPGPLQPPSSFAAMADHEARAAALFAEAAKVIQSPRCLNCHPVTRQPTQGDDLHAHVPPIDAGQGGHGRPGLPCSSCHQAANVGTQGAAIASVPGHAHWSLAPLAMGWQGRSAGDVCRQLKDPSRNGGRNLAKVLEHVSHDSLVGWAWNPGGGRLPAPGTQAGFAALIQAWIEAGASCPA